MTRSVFIARNRSTGFHSLLEVVGSGNPAPTTKPMDFELAERLLRWGTLDELVSAISESEPLIDRSIYREESRRLSISDAIEIVEESVNGEHGFGRCSEKSLFLQLCLEGTSATGSASSLYPSRASVRNLGSLVLRLMANIAAGHDDVLERSGFRHFDEMRRRQIAGKLMGSCWVLPFKHAPSIDMTLNYSTRRFGNVFAYMVADPLERRFLDLRPKGNGDLFGSVPNAILMTSAGSRRSRGPSCIWASTTAAPKGKRRLPSWSPLPRCWRG